MGERHQAFLVARFGSGSKARYRCIAVIHNQYISGIYIPGAASRFILQVQQTSNAEIIREELRRLEENESLWELDLPSRYLASMLASAYLISLQERITYKGGKGLEWSVRERVNDYRIYDNNHGYSIFDITNVGDCAYGFIPGHCTPGYEVLASPVILDAFDYVNAYRYEGEKLSEEERSKDVDIPDGSSGWIADTLFLLTYPLITARVLSDIWPESPRVSQDRINPTDTAPRPVKRFTIPPLSQLALLPAIRHQVEVCDVENEKIEILLQIPGQAGAILSLFKTSPDFQPLPDSAIPLLLRLLDGNHADPIEHLDLSSHHLSTSQISRILNSHKFVKTLNLSHNPLVKKETIRAVLSTHPQLKKLILLNTPVSKTEWSELLMQDPRLFFHLDAVIHPCFIDAHRPFYPNAFTIASALRGDEFGQGNTCSIAFFTPSLIVQALTVFLTAFMDQSDSAAIDASTAAATVALSTEVMDPDLPWRSRPVPYFAPRLRSNFSRTGWVFAFATRARQFGFIRFNPPIAAMEHPGEGIDDSGASAISVYDLQGFLAEMDKEGRPPAPPTAVTQLSGILANLSFEDYRSNRLRFRLMSEAEAQEFIDSMDRTLDVYLRLLALYEHPDEPIRRHET